VSLSLSFDPYHCSIVQEASVFVHSLLSILCLNNYTMRFSISLAVPAFLTLANAAVIGKRAASGEATFYGGNVAGGACSFSTYTLPSNIFGTALSDSNWDNSANCGACVSVTGPDGNAITAMVFLLAPYYLHVF
jgi:hypothetical protein